MASYINDNVKVEQMIDIIKKSFEIINSASLNQKFFKDDGTVVTQADIDVSNYISIKLRDLDNNTDVISEEKELEQNCFLNHKYWLIDPIDGTNNFVKRGNEFTVNIALIINGIPEFGIIGHPPSKKIWYSLQKKSYLLANNKLKKLYDMKKNIKNPLILCSRGLDVKTELFLKKNNLFNIKKLSSSMKFCILAEGKADIYPRFESISKWDIAAGDAILRGTGGATMDINFNPIFYDTPSPKTGMFIAVSTSFNKKSNIQKLIINNIIS